MNTPECTVFMDTPSDLPRVENGATKLEMSHKDKPISHFQRKIRKGFDILKDYITKPMSARVEARFRLIPMTPGSDWRDLPNKVMTLKNGKNTHKLAYCYNDFKQGKSHSGALPHV